MRWASLKSYYQPSRVVIHALHQSQLDVLSATVDASRSHAIILRWLMNLMTTSFHLDYRMISRIGDGTAVCNNMRRDINQRYILASRSFVDLQQ